jgi:hypothetical protein
MAIVPASESQRGGAHQHHGQLAEHNAAVLEQSLLDGGWREWGCAFLPLGGRFLQMLIKRHPYRVSAVVNTR